MMTMKVLNIKMDFRRKSKGALPALAILAAVVFLFIILMTYAPEIKATFMDILEAIFG